MSSRIKPGERRLVAPSARRTHGFPAEVVIVEYLGLGAYRVRGEGLNPLAALNQSMLLEDTPETREWVGLQMRRAAIEDEINEQAAVAFRAAKAPRQGELDAIERRSQELRASGRVR